MTTETRRLSVVDQAFGHNRAPIEEVLKADFADLVADVERRIEEAKNEAPKTIKGEADLLTAGRLIKDLRATAKLAEAKRTDEKAPILAAQRAIDGFFRELVDKLTGAAKPIQSAADDYARRQAAAERERIRREQEIARQKEEAARAKIEAAKTPQAAAKAAAEAESHAALAEAGNRKAEPTRGAGVTAGKRTGWEFSIEDYNAIDLNALRPFLARAEVEKAIRAVVRIQKGDTDIKGVRVYESAKANFR